MQDLTVDQNCPYDIRHFGVDTLLAEPIWQRINIFADDLCRDEDACSSYLDAHKRCRVLIYLKCDDLLV